MTFTELPALIAGSEAFAFLTGICAPLLSAAEEPFPLPVASALLDALGLLPPPLFEAFVLDLSLEHAVKDATTNDRAKADIAIFFFILRQPSSFLSSRKTTCLLPRNNLLFIPLTKQN
ncbi:hypothetical protein [Cohnella xylanilytica]|uniref:hypothetical protein n=1 Tax=Cohnella xylanilytica TaxID=557555 RepID=UPI001FE54387|nr:hypothetical protein [Cohnella xylanilytica]